jgi:hypothetical protein
MSALDDLLAAHRAGAGGQEPYRPGAGADDLLELFQWRALYSLGYLQGAASRVDDSDACKNAGRALLRLLELLRTEDGASHWLMLVRGQSKP